LVGPGLQGAGGVQVSSMELIGGGIRVWIIMLDPRLFAVFLAAAFLLAITPGPGIVYVLTRTLTGGTQEGVLSSLGTFLGGLIHVIAAALGLSAILSTSATAFLIVKYVGAIYLIWIGIKMIWTRDREPGKRSSSGNSTRAIHQGVLTELLNPKTALFFLSFLPQFVSPEKENVIFQFLVLGIVSVSLNTGVDLVVVMLAVPLGRLLRTNTRFLRNQRVASGAGLIGLGTFVALSDRK
jgi:threonine/homoserine/homoserine lactone efflux protein